MTFYFFLSYTFTNPEKKIININNLITEIRKVKKKEKENCFKQLNEKKKKKKKKRYLTDNIISIPHMDCAQTFLIKKQVEYTWKIFRKNGVGLFFTFCVYVCVFLNFF